MRRCFGRSRTPSWPRKSERQRSTSDQRYRPGPGKLFRKAGIIEIADGAAVGVTIKQISTGAGRLARQNGIDRRACVGTFRAFIRVVIAAQENMQWPNEAQKQTAQPKRPERLQLQKLLQRLDRLARTGSHRRRGAVLELRDLPLPSRANSNDRLKLGARWRSIGWLNFEPSSPIRKFIGA